MWSFEFSPAAADRLENQGLRDDGNPPHHFPTDIWSWIVCHSACIRPVRHGSAAGDVTPSEFLSIVWSPALEYAVLLTGV